MGVCLCSPLPLGAQIASPSVSMAETIRLTAGEGRRGGTSTCRVPSPHDSCRSSVSPAPSGQCGLISRSKAPGSHRSAGSLFPAPHPSRLDSPYPLAPGHAWVSLHFGPSPSMGTYQGPSLLLVANCSHPRPSSSHKTHTPHTPQASTQPPRPHCAPRPGCLCPPEGALRCWGQSAILGACHVVDG